MDMNIAQLAILITLLVSVVGIAGWAGKLSERVGNNRYDIEEIKKSALEARKENRAEHLEMVKLIRNGGK